MIKRFILSTLAAAALAGTATAQAQPLPKIGRASCRERV